MTRDGGCAPFIGTSIPEEIAKTQAPSNGLMALLPCLSCAEPCRVQPRMWPLSKRRYHGSCRSTPPSCPNPVLKQERQDRVLMMTATNPRPRQAERMQVCRPSAPRSGRSCSRSTGVTRRSGRRRPSAPAVLRGPPHSGSCSPASRASRCGPDFDPFVIDAATWELLASCNGIRVRGPSVVLSCACATPGRACAGPAQRDLYSPCAGVAEQNK